MINDLERLTKPVGKKIDVVLDTDTYNEIDDQFALAYMIKSDDKLNLKAIYAAPFSNQKSSGPKDGMLKSYDEIINILTLMDRKDFIPNVFMGSEEYLKDEKTYVNSDAALDLAERAKSYTQEEPLYVVAIGAITNIASAILMDPEIIDKIVVVWLGGHAHTWPDNGEFNIKQDVAGARVLFGCGAALVQLPCMGVVSSFTISGPELNCWLKGKNKLCDYLVELTEREAAQYHKEKTWSRVIWDVTAVAWLLDGDFMQDVIVHAPIPEYDHRYSFDDRRHFMKYVYYINRDKLVQDLFEKLSK